LAIQNIVSRIEVFWNVWLWSVFPDISDDCSALIIRTMHPEVDGTTVLCSLEPPTQ